MDKSTSCFVLARFSQFWLNSDCSGSIITVSAHFPQLWLNSHSYGSTLTVLTQLSQFLLNYHSYGSFFTFLAQLSQFWLSSQFSVLAKLSHLWLNYHSYGSIITVMAQFSQLWLSAGSVLAQFSLSSRSGSHSSDSVLTVLAQCLPSFLVVHIIHVYCTTSSSTHVLLQVVQETTPKPIKIKYIIIKYIYKQCACLSQADGSFSLMGERTKLLSVLAQFSPTISYSILCGLLVRFRVFSVQQFRFVAAINRLVAKLTNRQSDRICCAPVAV